MINIYKTNAMKKYTKNNFDMGGIEIHNIEFPKHILVCAATGTGKSNWLSNYLTISSQGSGTFGHITIVCKQSEPIYEMLQEQLKDNLTMITNLKDLPPLEKFGNKSSQQLLVFDDCVAEKDQSKIEEYFLRGRKYGEGIQVMYLSQSYFKTPIFIRQNISYLILLSLSSDADLSRIMTNYNVGIHKDIFKKIFKNAVSNRMCCFKINIATTDLNKKFSRNWNEFYEIVDNNNEPLNISQIQTYSGSGLLN